MNSRGRLRSAVVTACVCIATLLGFAGSAKAQDEAGWQALWGNKIGVAGKLFRQALVRNPNDREALRGLGWTSYYKDDDVGALNYWCRAVVLAPTDWTSTALWPIIMREANLEGRYDSVESIAAVLATTPGVLPEIRSSAQMVLAHRADRGSVVQGNLARKPLGFITKWSVVGPFDNVSKSGFDKVFGPEQTVHLSDNYTGKDDLTVKWHSCPLISRDGECSVGSFLGGSDPGVFYATTALNVAADTAAYLRFDATGAAKVYTNGASSLIDGTYRNRIEGITDAVTVPVALHSGWNTILIKVTDDDGTNSDFRLRVTDKDGLPITLLGVDPNKADGFTVVSGASAEGTSVKSWLADAIGDHAASIEGAVCLGYSAAATDDYQGAEDILNAALASHPKCAALHWALSWTLQGDGQDDESRAQCAAARELTHDIALAELSSATEDKSQTSSVQVKLLKSLALKFPLSDDVGFQLAAVLQDASLNAEAFSLAKKLCMRIGGGAVLTRMAQLEGYNDDRKAQVRSLLRAGLAKDPSDWSLLAEYGRIIDDSDRAQETIQVYSKLRSLAPHVPLYEAELATAYRNAGNPHAELTALKSVVILRPQDSSAQANLGDALQERGDHAGAVAAYREAIKLSPEDTDLRDKLQLLSGQKPILDLAPALATPDLAHLAGKPADKAPSMVSLVDEKREVVYPDYTTQSSVHEVLKVNDPAAVESVQTFELSRPSSAATIVVENARLIKADGKIEDHTGDDVSDGAITFPSLAPGDIIDISYRVEDRGKGTLSHEFWTDWSFGDFNTKCNHSRMVLITPKDMSYTFVSHGGTPAPTERVQGAWLIRQWEIVNGPVLREDPGSVTLRDLGPWLDVSTVPTWNRIISWYEDLSAPRCKPDAAIRAKAAELTKDDKTEDDKIKRLVEYVSHDVQYQSTPFRLSAYVPTEGKDVIRERYGDCKDKAALLTAMLGALGISSHMVLLSPREYGVTPYLPSPRFAHAIAVVDTASGPLWIDGTADGLAYRSLPTGDQGVPALVIKPDTSSLDLSPVLPVGPGIKLDYAGKVSMDGLLTCHLVITAEGNSAWTMRSYIKKVTFDKMDQFLSLLCGSIAGMTYDTGSVDGAEDPTAPLKISIDCHDPHFATPAGDFLMISMPWAARFTKATSSLDLLSAPGRTSDLDVIAARCINRFDAKLELPGGYSVENLKPKVAGESPWGSYSFTYETHGNVLEAHGEEAYTATRVSSADVTKWAAFERSIMDEGGAKLVLKKSQP